MKDGNKEQWTASISEAEKKLQDYLSDGLPGTAHGSILIFLNRLARARERLEQDDPDWIGDLFDD